ncbi:MAG: endolytic transglycosylase MltG [Actinomycetota bacterium]|nr:endolytic transglycosylase MltG [Actinomycetota bacterium]
MTDRREPASGHGDHIVFDDPDLDQHVDSDLGDRDDEHADDHAYAHEYDEYDDHHDGLHILGRGERRAADRRRPKRGRRALRRLLVFVVAIALIGAAAFAAVSVLRPMVAGFGGESGDFAGPGSGAVQVTVNPGDTGRAMATNLATLGVVKTAKAFADAAADNPASGNIQPGEYTLKKEMKASDAVTYLIDPANRTVPRVTIPEGRWTSEVFALLSKATGKPVSDYETAAKDAAALGLPASAKGNVEGYLFPATYEFAKETSAAQQLKTMVQKALDTMTGLGITGDGIEQTVITASILEAEGRTTADREKVARVLLNRIAQNQPLQLDSTVSYGVQKRALTTSDAERADKNPYNTYVNVGLPAGPIGNPGQSALEAAKNPADGPWLFFVTVNPTTGETKFASSLAEHDQYVKEFQAWCQANTGKC